MGETADGGRVSRLEGPNPSESFTRSTLTNCASVSNRGRTPSKQNRNFRPKGEGRSDRRPLLPKRKLNILVDITLGKSYHSVVTFLHAQKIKCYTFSIQTSSELISYYVCPWKVGP